MKPWSAPKWMRPYLPMICNTGGNDVTDMMNGNADPRVNLPLSTLQCAVKSQVLLLIKLHEVGMLPPPHVTALHGIVFRQKRALREIELSADVVAESRALPRRLVPGMKAIAEAARRGLGA